MMRFLVPLLLVVWFPADSLEASFRVSSDSTKTHFFFYPILYYTPETSLALGGTAQYVYRPAGVRPEERPSAVMPMLVYTLKNQVIASLPLDLYWNQDAFHLFADLGYREYPDVFWGIGNDTKDRDREEFTSRELGLRLSITWRFAQGFYAGARYESIHSKLTETEEEGLLAAGNIAGSGRGLASGLGLMFHRDTRDNLFYPGSGGFHQLNASWFAPALGSDYVFGEYTADLREYIPLFRSGVLALQAFLQVITGSPPFYMLSQLGGSNVMRGYFHGRYRDRNSIALQAEYRFPVWGPVGGVVFGGFGGVSREAGNLLAGKMKPSCGFGIRFRLDPREKINLRLDFGFGRGSRGIYFGAAEAF